MIGYQQRFYSPVLGRWLNRDPIEEAGGENIYVFCKNNSTVNSDYLGLTAVSISMGTEVRNGKLGESEFIKISITVWDPPQKNGKLNFIQLRRNTGGDWRVDCSDTLGPYYYSLREVKEYTEKSANNMDVISLYDSPSGFIDPVYFYVAVVELHRLCKPKMTLGRMAGFSCYDQVKVIATRTWQYDPNASKSFLYENKDAGMGMLPTLRKLINMSSWRTELCSQTTVEIQ